jgi:hypothetical protein
MLATRAGQVVHGGARLRRTASSRPRTVVAVGALRRPPSACPRTVLPSTLGGRAAVSTRWETRLLCMCVPGHSPIRPFVGIRPDDRVLRRREEGGGVKELVVSVRVWEEHKMVPTPWLSAHTTALTLTCVVAAVYERGR